MHGRGAIVLSVVCCAACGSSKPTIPADCATVVRSGVLPSGALFSLAPAEVTAGVQFIGCSAAQQATAVVAVVGPDDHAVASTSTVEVAPSTFAVASQLMKDSFDAGQPTDGLTALVHVKFTPAQAGTYHLTARVEPALGTVQAEVNVLDDRRSTSFHTLPMPFQCDDFDLQGAVGLCLSGQALLAIVDGGQVSSIPAIAFAADHGDVWSVGPSGNSVSLAFSTLTAFGSLTPVASTDFGGYQQGSNAVLQSSGRRVAVAAPLSASGFVLFEASFDGGIVLGESRQLDTPLGLVALQWAPDAGFILGGRQFFGTGAGDQVCEFSLIDGGQSCVTGSLFLDNGPTTVGSDGAALWSKDSMGALTAWSALSDGGFATTATSFGSLLFLPLGSGGNPSGPVFRDQPPAGVQLPSLAPPYLLQAYGLPPSLPNTPTRWGSSSRLYWEWHADNGGTIVYFER